MLNISNNSFKKKSYNSTHGLEKVSIKSEKKEVEETNFGVSPDEVRKDKPSPLLSDLPNVDSKYFSSNSSSSSNNSSNTTPYFGNNKQKYDHTLSDEKKKKINVKKDDTLNDTYFNEITVDSIARGNNIIETNILFPRCEFYHRYPNTSIFTNNIDYAHVYTRSEAARYTKGNKSRDGSGVKFLPRLLTSEVDKKSNSLSAHTGGFASPYILEKYSKNVKLNKYDFDNKYQLNRQLYDEILKYKLGLCQYVVNQFCAKKANINLGSNEADQGIYCSNNYPCVLVRFTPRIEGKNVSKAERLTFYKRYNHLLMAYFIAIVDYNAYQADIQIEMVSRSSFGHSNPSIAVTDKSFRINIGIVPQIYADIIVTSLIQLYDLFYILETCPTNMHLIMDNQLRTRLNNGRTVGFNNQLLPHTYWAALWAKGSGGSTGRIMLSELLERERDRAELLANFVLEEIIEEPENFFINPVTAEAPLAKIFALVTYTPNTKSTQKKPLSQHISVHSKARLSKHAGFNAVETSDKTINIDNNFKQIIEKICDGLAIDLPQNLKIKDLYKFLEIAHIQFIYEKRTRTSNKLNNISGWGSDSDTEVVNPTKTKSIFAKKIIVANGMLAINLAYYAARSAISFIEAIKESKEYDIDEILDDYTERREHRSISIDYENSYFEVEDCLKKAVKEPTVCKSQPADILLFDLNSFNAGFISQQVSLEDKLQITKPMVVILDHTSSTSDVVNKSVRLVFQHYPSVKMIFLVNSGLKNEQGGADNNPYGKITFVSLSNAFEDYTLTHFIYDEITKLTTDSVEIKLHPKILLPKAAHAIRHSYKDRGFTSTSANMLSEVFQNRSINSEGIPLGNKATNTDEFEIDDDLSYMLTLMYIERENNDEFNILVEIGASEIEIYNLYQNSKKFEAMTQDDIINLIKNKDLEISFEDISDIYDDEPNLFSAILHDVSSNGEGLIDQFSFEKFCDTFRGEYDKKHAYYSEDSEDDVCEESFYDNTHGRLLKENNPYYTESSDSENDTHDSDY